MQPAPFLELLPQADHVEERLLSRESADRRAVIGIEVAMHRDAARLGERDRLFDLSPLEVMLLEFSAGAGADGFHSAPTHASAGARAKSGARSRIRLSDARQAHVWTDGPESAQLARPVRVLG